MDESFEREVLQRLTALETKLEAALKRIEEELVNKSRDHESRIRSIEDWKTSFTSKVTLIGTSGIFAGSLVINMILSYFGFGH